MPYYYAATRSFASRNISGLSRHSFTGDHCTKVHQSAPVLQVELAIHCYHTSLLHPMVNVIPVNYFCTPRKKIRALSSGISFSFYSSSDSDASSSASSKASMSAKYALCFSKRSSSKLGVLAMDRFCFRNGKQLES